jgi:ankyrin repeat protein
LSRLTEAGTLDAELDLNFAVTPSGITPFILAASVGYVPILALLAQNPTVRKNGNDKEGFNAVYYAAHYGKLDALKHLKS